jgi:hypothetical protein
MIFALVVGVLALASIVATIRTVSIDGYRHLPYTPIARNPEPAHR